MSFRSTFGVLMLLLAGYATAGDFAINQPEVDPSPDVQTLEIITWPVLPGENLNLLSARLFPDNEALQAVFVSKTIKLNANEMPHLNAEVYFTSPTAIRVPNPKMMFSGIHPIKPADETTKQLSLQSSYRLSVQGNEAPKKIHEAEISVKSDDVQLWWNQQVWTPVQAFFGDLSIENAKEKLFGNPAGTGGLSRAYQAVIDYVDTQDKTRLALWTFAIMAFLLGVYLPIKAKRKFAASVATPLLRQEPDFVTGSLLPKTAAPIITTQAQIATEVETQVDEYTDQSVLEEAQNLVQKNMVDDAIAHVQWAIRAKPRTSIVIWLYMLDLMKQQMRREEFEAQAQALHQQYNVVAPAWENLGGAVPAELSLESHPHIAKKITAQWPMTALKPYLQSLVSDHREGERGGFSVAEIEEILLLINVLDAQQVLETTDIPVNPETASADHSDNADPAKSAE